MNPVDAIRLMVRNYPGGVEALAVIVGKSPDTLRHEIGGRDTRYKLGVTDACAISDACIAISSEHCHAFANAVAVNCGGFVRLEVRDTPPANLQSDLAAVVKEAADVLTTGTASLADGVISDNDYRSISKELHELQEAIQRAQCALEAAHKGGLRAVRT